MQTEHVILLNAQEFPRVRWKSMPHTADTLLHLAFSSWLFNAKGQLLVTRRALSKKHGLACGLTRFVGTHNWEKATKTQ